MGFPRRSTAPRNARQQRAPLSILSQINTGYLVDINGISALQLVPEVSGIHRPTRSVALSDLRACNEGSDAGRRDGRGGEGRGCCTWSRSRRRASFGKIMVQYATNAELGMAAWKSKDAHINETLGNA